MRLSKRRKRQWNPSIRCNRWSRRSSNLSKPTRSAHKFGLRKSKISLWKWKERWMRPLSTRTRSRQTSKKAYLKRNPRSNKTMRKQRRRLRMCWRLNKRNLRLFKMRSLNQTNRLSKNWRIRWGRTSHCTILCRRLSTLWSLGKAIARQSLFFRWKSFNRFKHSRDPSLMFHL